MRFDKILFLICTFFLFFLNNSYAGDKGYTVKFLFSFPEGKISGLGLSQPEALSIDLKGIIYVVDTGNNRIIQFDHHGKYIYTIGGFGWETEQFDRPLDVSVKTGLDVFIADYNNERIERYDKNLNYISSFTSDQSLSPSLQFGFPASVEISKHGELFICDNENDRILKLNFSGEPLLSFGDFNWGEGQLELPTKLEVTSNDLVYVSDQGANDIVVYDYYGNYVKRFGSKILNKPNGLAWSNDGKLFVADSGNHRLAVFDGEHNFIFSWGDYGDKNGAFENPVDVAIFDKRIYVLDSDRNQIQVFELIEN